MNGVQDPTRNRRQNSSSNPQVNPLPIKFTEDLEANLATELAEYQAQVKQPADLPVVPPEEFESLYSWFIS